MQKRCINEIAVSVLGLGTVKFGRTAGVKYPHHFVLPSDQEIIELLALAKDLGMNFLDTAPAYELSEARLGRALQEQRQDWVLMSKVGETFQEGQSTFDFSPSALIASVERSLTRLSTDYLDIVLVHSSGDDVRIIEQMEVFITLERLKRAGKIRAFGLSSKTVEGARLTIEHADCVMMTFDAGLIARAAQLDKGVFIKKAFNSGHALIQDAALGVQKALQTIFAQPGVTSVIVGTINPQHLRQNVALLHAVLSNPVSAHADVSLSPQDKSLVRVVE